MDSERLLPKAVVLESTDHSITYSTDRGQVTVTGDRMALLSTVVYQDGSRERIEIDPDTIVTHADFSRATDQQYSDRPNKDDSDYSAESGPLPEDVITREEALSIGRPEFVGLTHSPVIEAYDK